jgi:signal transduction histidine kinase
MIPEAPTQSGKTDVAAPGRENRPVSELPPPSPSGAPPPPPGAHRDARRRGPISSSDPTEWDWDRIRDLAERWYRPLVEAETWRALGYLFVGTFSSVGFFLALVAFGALTFGLLFVGVGFLLIAPWFGLARVFADAERAMARWAGVEIEPRPLRSAGTLGWRSVTDPERWRIVGYLMLNVLLAPILLGLGTALFSFAVRAVFGSETIGGLGVWPIAAVAGVLAIALGLVALGAAPRVAVMVAALKANVTAWFLGPDRLAEAEERVTKLSTQRQDILDAVAGERRRIERNLHDGVQQQLVAIGLDLGMAEQQLDRDPARARELIVNARHKVQGSIGELRQLGRGLHPAILEDRGIDAALSAIVSGAPIPVTVHVDDDLDLDTDVAETVYFIANEALANVLKHSRARVASVHVARVAANVRVTVHDDGIGGADPDRGTGLAGIRARVHAADGTLHVTSPPGGPTTIVAELPRRVERRRGASPGAATEEVTHEHH